MKDLTVRVLEPIEFHLLVFFSIIKLKLYGAQFHLIYKTMNLGERTYIMDSGNLKEIKLIIKIRGEVVELNCKPWIEKTLGAISVI